MANQRELNILLVEDDDVDVRAIQRAFKQRKFTNPMYVAHDGIEALEVLRGENGQDPIPRPYIILLDLQLPRMTGLEFLAQLRKDPELTRSIVIVLTTSDNDKDICEAYDQHIAGYLLKRDTGTDFVNVIQMIEPFSIAVQFPPDKS